MQGFEIETERYVLGCIAQGEAYAAESNLSLKAEDFSQRENQVLFELMQEMYMAGEAITVRTFPIRYREELKKLGVSWTGIVDVFANMGDFKAAVKKLKTATQARELLALSDTIREEIESGTPVKEVAAKVEQQMMAHGASAAREYLSPKEMAARCLEVVAERMDEASRKRKMIYTSFRRFNQAIGGMEAGDLVILSGETGGGKSAFAANLARDIAVTQKQPLLYINSEMSADQMALRWSALIGGYDHGALRGGRLEEGEFARLAGKLDAFYGGKLYTATIPDMKVNVVLSEIKRAKKHNEVRAVVVDYIGRMDFDDTKSREDWQVMTGAARKLKTIAQEEQLLVIMIAQLNASGRLAQASYMTHEADLWINLKKPSEDEIRRFNGEPWNLILEIKKARNSKLGKLPLYFYGEQLRYIDDLTEAAMIEKMRNPNGRVWTQ